MLNTAVTDVQMKDGCVYVVGKFSRESTASSYIGYRKGYARYEIVTSK